MILLFFIKTHYDTIIRYYFSYYFSYYDTLDYYFSYYFFHYDTLFFIIFCLHPDNGIAQTAILDLCTEEPLISVHEEGPFTWINWKARIQNGKHADGLFLAIIRNIFTIMHIILLV